MNDPNSQVFFDPWEERGHSRDPRPADDSKNGVATAVSDLSVETSDCGVCEERASRWLMLAAWIGGPIVGWLILYGIGLALYNVLARLG